MTGGSNCKWCPQNGDKQTSERLRQSQNLTHCNQASTNLPAQQLSIIGNDKIICNPILLSEKYSQLLTSKVPPCTPDRISPIGPLDDTEIELFLEPRSDFVLPTARTAIGASQPTAITSTDPKKNLNHEETASQRRDSGISTPRKAPGRLPSCPWLLRLADSAANPSAARPAGRPARGQLGKGTAGRNRIGGLTS
jgi:hypothetical protein